MPCAPGPDVLCTVAVDDRDRFATLETLMGSHEPRDPCANYYNVVFLPRHTLNPVLVFVWTVVQTGQIIDIDTSGTARQ